MTFLRFTYLNLRRSPARSLLTALSVMVSAASLTAVLSLDRGYIASVHDDLVNRTGVHLYITKEGCPIEAASVIAQGGLSPLYVEAQIADRVAAMPEVKAVLPFQLFAVTTEDGSRTDIFMGITEAIMEIRPDWTLEKGGWFVDSSSVILGAEMARIERLEPGQKLYLEQFDREFTVSGILRRNYTQDDGVFFLPLAVAQQMVGRQGKLSAAAVKVRDISRLEEIRDRIRAALPQEYFVIGAKELSDGVLKFFGSTRAIMFLMVLVAFAVSAFGIMNTMLMSVMERRKEMAYLKCIGAGARDLVNLIGLETLGLCLTGSLIGIVAGAALSPLFGEMVRSLLVAYVPSGPVARPDLQIALATLGVCIVVGLLSAIYPSLKAARIVPMEVLRND